MRTETIFDRVPGCRDKRKAKRAANWIARGQRLNARRQFAWLKDAKAKAAICAESRRHRAWTLRRYVAQAAL